VLVIIDIVLIVNHIVRLVQVSKWLPVVYCYKWPVVVGE